MSEGEERETRLEEAQAGEKADETGETGPEWRWRLGSGGGERPKSRKRRRWTRGA